MGFDPRTIQRVASCYANYDIPAQYFTISTILKFLLVWTEKTTQNLCFNHDIVTEGCFQYFTHFQCSFPESGKSVTHITRSFQSFIRKSWRALNLLAPELFFLILTHPVYKMWIIQEPNTLELWNKLHFEEEKRRVYTMFKIFSTYICWINI